MTSDKVLEVKGSTLTVFNANPGSFLTKFRTDYPTWLADAFPLATLDLTQAGDIHPQSAQMIVRAIREIQPGGPNLLIKVAPGQDATFHAVPGGAELPLRIVDAAADAAERERRRKAREDRLSTAKKPRARPPAAPRLTTQAIEMEMLDDDEDDDEPISTDAGPKILELDGAGAEPFASPTGIEMIKPGETEDDAARRRAREAAAEQAPPPIAQLGNKETLTLFLSSSDDDEDDVEYVTSVVPEPMAPALDEVETIKGRPLPARDGEPEPPPLSGGPTLRKEHTGDVRNWAGSARRTSVDDSGPWTGEERRRWGRFVVNDGFVLFKKHDGTPILKGQQLWRGPIVNISQGGIQFITNHGVAMGKRLRMMLDLPAFQEKVSADGRIVWVQDIDKGDKVFFKVGISLEKMTPDDAALLMRLEENEDLRTVERVKPKE